MKKILVYTVLAALLFSSCDSYTGAGAYTGAGVGRVLGSAIGGLTGGRHGYEVGTIAGMAGGAIVGAAIGSRADRRQREQYEQYQQDRTERIVSRADVKDSPTNDVIAFDSYEPSVVVKNVRFFDSNGDNVIGRGEVCRVEFEVFNVGPTPLYDLQPIVAETTGNKHIIVSPSEFVRSLSPNRGIRYTAIVSADRRLKAGSAQFCVGVLQNGAPVSEAFNMNIATSR